MNVLFYFIAAEITLQWNFYEIFLCLLQWPCKSLQDCCIICFVSIHTKAHAVCSWTLCTWSLMASRHTTVNSCCNRQSVYTLLLLWIFRLWTLYKCLLWKSFPLLSAPTVSYKWSVSAWSSLSVAWLLHWSTQKVVHCSFSVWIY